MQTGRQWERERNREREREMAIIRPLRHFPIHAQFCVSSSSLWALQDHNRAKQELSGKEIRIY